MARSVRIEYPGAVYHAMCRGNCGGDIFLEDGDRAVFLSTLQEACERTRWVLHAYVLMNNHYHLLLETPEANLVAGMKWFQGAYTQRFNARNRRQGHLYQGRYKATLIDPNEADYFNKVSSYIHLNPVRVGLCCRDNLKLEHYQWSSYPYYLKPPRQRPVCLEIRRVLESFDIGSGQQGRERDVQDLYARAGPFREKAKRKGDVGRGAQRYSAWLVLGWRRVSERPDELAGETRRQRSE